MHHVPKKADSALTSAESRSTAQPKSGAWIFVSARLVEALVSYGDLDGPVIANAWALVAYHALDGHWITFRR
jgi:hypothetical protein